MVLSGALAVAGLLAGAAPVTPLRVCADPNNLPFSNQRREGFENRIAELVGEELHRPVAYTWAPEWRGFVRKTLGSGRCDVVLGIPAASDRVLATRPYYTSTYVFLSRRDRGLDIRSLDDPRLRQLRIGIHFIGDDYVNPPPAHALARRHIVNNVVGYSIYGNYARPNPPSDLVRAVARREVDLAIIWGPFAGYFARRFGVPMRLEPVTPALDPPGLRFTFAIAAGVRPADTALRAAIDAALARRQADIGRVLRRYGVPLVSTSLAAEGVTSRVTPAGCARGISTEASCSR
jgi:quinoprotein dehydrogenase-associated probable ABC transporter substrate-binding protein